MPSVTGVCPAMRHKWILGLTWGLMVLVVQSAAQSFTYISIDVPCANCPGGVAQTTAFGIGPGGAIVGTYSDVAGVQHGFLSGGQLTTIDVPGWLVGASGTLPTNARGISPAGEIVAALPLR